jgi:hypothetical protein
MFADVLDHADADDLVVQVLPMDISNIPNLDPAAP